MLQADYIEQSDYIEIIPDDCIQEILENIKGGVLND